MARLDAPGPRRPDPRTGSPADRPFLGICLGLQLLFEGSDEDGAETLGVAAAAGRSASTDAPTLPHIGWNQVERDARRTRCSPGSADGADFYFVHSYAGAPSAPTRATPSLAETTHGGPFVSAVARGNACSASSSTPSGAARDGLRLLVERRRVVRSRGARRPASASAA